ncbi:unnamed protein product [Acanthoscelides obtectus]|uniref:Uncharacterized protein n=1 Tax=Acanthoscelides obtectus TaxID=200917 RepID=A0A9P0LKJ9_ACAOB|nr:unnamed protein product [Acanthoscelides obtectus]CAK1663085.1 hypothetical protein AOBTE_LOCUS23476 [Acanthoscelides obtectus]
MCPLLTKSWISRPKKNRTKK